MSIKKIQFDVLSAIEYANKIMSESEISAKTGIPADAVTDTVKELLNFGFINDKSITQAGIEALQPYRVRRAVFMAAGFGSRLVPITLNTPKPLVRVNGKRIIDTILDACIDVGIDEIYIIRGYLKEQFDQLLYKYPGIKFIDNPFYNEANNISSVFAAGNLLQNAYLFESDLLINNPKIVKKYQYASNFVGCFREKTDDWCVYVDKNLRIYDEKIGGDNCYQIFGVTYINSEDGVKLEKHIKEIFNLPGGKKRYWSTVPLLTYGKYYNIYVRPISDKDIVEIDTFEDLKANDKSYDVI
ncbi:MAG: phosphocholine cytidylyltransferase family protein [Clostridia bacterium]|nr:phosphocholine cytidylyltransferase family protein [Clostridia bacterium]